MTFLLIWLHLCAWMRVWTIDINTSFIYIDGVDACVRVWTRVWVCVALSYKGNAVYTVGMLRRAVFNDCQRKGLERVFQQQKYISKPDRKLLADRLALKDSQVTYRDIHVCIPIVYVL